MCYMGHFLNIKILFMDKSTIFLLSTLKQKTRHTQRVQRCGMSLLYFCPCGIPITNITCKVLKNRNVVYHAWGWISQQGVPRWIFSIVRPTRGYWRENRNAADNILSLVRDNTSAVLAVMQWVRHLSWFCTSACGLYFYWTFLHITWSLRCRV